MKNSMLVMSVVVFCFQTIFAGTYGGGNGSSGSPYQIATAAHLAELSSTSSDWGTGIYFEQTNNITVSGGWTPIGNSSTNFCGIYNGKGYKVSGISINNSSYNQGFFGYTNGAVIENLGVDVSISANGTSGGLIGYAMSTTITNCYSTGSVSVYYDCAGGLIGTVNSCTVSGCYSTAVVNAGTSGSSGSYSGGLIAKTDNTASTISNSYHTTGRVGGRDYVGGVIGALMNSATLSRCYSTGLVEGLSQTGGLVGNNGATINNCYSHAVANCGNTAGGFVGNNTSDGTITNSYSTGNPGATTNEGGFAGQNGGTISNCFWDKTTSESETSAGGTGKTTAEMKTLATFTDAGWDFEAESANGTNNYWDMDLAGSYNNGYPFLSWENGSDVSLPVELTDFTAKSQSGVVLLSWSTESETENLGFILEKRGKETGEWKQVASYLTDKTLEGYGSTSEKHEYQYTDQAVQPGATYLYRLGDVDYSGKLTWHKEVEVKVEAEIAKIPAEFGLQAAYPNPFNPVLNIRYGLTEDGQMTLKVYNLRGELVEELMSTYALKGTYSYTWQPVNLSSGVYVVHLHSGGRTVQRKIMFVK